MVSFAACSQPEQLQSVTVDMKYTFQQSFSYFEIIGEVIRIDKPLNDKKYPRQLIKVIAAFLEHNIPNIRK
jgi:hypothetical protein